MVWRKESDSQVYPENIKIVLNKILVIYNAADRSDPTEEETKIGAEKIFNYLRGGGCDVSIRKVFKNRISEFVREVDRNTLVFNYCEWTGKKCKYEIELLERMAKRGISFTGCNARQHEILLDKTLMVEKFRSFGVPMLGSVMMNANDDAAKLAHIKYPAIVKTTLEHCSIGLTKNCVVYDGVSAVRQVRRLYKKFRQPIMVEEFANGNEYQVFVFRTRRGVRTLPVYETQYRKLHEPVLITYAENWLGKSISKKVKRIGVTMNQMMDRKIRRMGVELFKKLGSIGYIRMDLRVRDSRLYVLEANPNPSIAWTEDLDFIKVCAEAAGKDFGQIIEWIISGSASRAQVVFGGRDTIAG